MTKAPAAARPGHAYILINIKKKSNPRKEEGNSFIFRLKPACKPCTMLKNVKGIGLKTAQRIIVDLRDKIVASGIADELHVSDQPVAMVNNSVKDEAVQALTMLGFSPAPSAKAVVAILKEHPDLPVEQVIKLALKQIK